VARNELRNGLNISDTRSPFPILKEKFKHVHICENVHYDYSPPWCCIVVAYALNCCLATRQWWTQTIRNSASCSNQTKYRETRNTGETKVLSCKV